MNRWLKNLSYEMVPVQMKKPILTKVLKFVRYQHFSKMLGLIQESVKMQ